MQKFKDQTTQNRLTSRALSPLLAAIGLCLSQFTAAQSSEIDASVSFNVPITLSCTSKLRFGNISIISTKAGDDNLSIYNSNNRLSLNPISGNTEGELIDNNNILVSEQGFGSCSITGVARGSTLNLSLSPSFNSTFGSLGSGGDNNISFIPLMVNAEGNTQGGGSTNTITISTSDDTDYGLNNSAYNSGAYEYSQESGGTFTFRIGGELYFGSSFANVPLADLAGTYTDSLTVLVEL